MRKGLLVVVGRCLGIATPGLLPPVNTASAGIGNPILCVELYRRAAISNICLGCGVCCMSYHIAFHWSETTAFEGGLVPVALTEPLRIHEVAMRGTNASSVRCIALAGTPGVDAQCSIHGAHPSCCREVAVGGDQCQRARLKHGLPPVAVNEVVAAYASSNPPAAPETVLAEVLDCVEPIVALNPAVTLPATNSVAGAPPVPVVAELWAAADGTVDEPGPRHH